MRAKQECLFKEANDFDDMLLCRDSLVWFSCLVQNKAVISSLSEVSTPSNPFNYITCAGKRRYGVIRPFLGAQHMSLPSDNSLMKRLETIEFHSVTTKLIHSRSMSNASIELKMDGDAVRFSFNKQGNINGSLTIVKEKAKRLKMSKKAKLNELRFYRLMAKKKMNSPNPEVRIRYKLEKVGNLLSYSIDILLGGVEKKIRFTF